MITLSTRSRARRLAGAALATVLVGVGLGLTASGSIAAPSKIMPVSVTPIIHDQSQAIMVADNGQGVANDSDSDHDSDSYNKDSDDNNDGDQADERAANVPTPPAPPLRPAPAASPMPLAPIAPMPPVAMTGMMAHEQIRQINDNTHQATQQALEQARQAGEAARAAVANIDFVKITHDAMIEARAELERECKHAKPAVAGETDAQAISRLSLGCVDMAAIGREVQAELAKAMEEVRADQDLSHPDRDRALATIDRTRTEMAKKFAQ